MKKSSNLTRGLIPFSLMLVGLMMIYTACEQSSVDYTNEVYQAYELRINGDADSAKVLLEHILEKDSTVALAWYELGRTEQHMAIGDMQRLMEHVEHALTDIGHAVQLEPNNPAFLYFDGVLKSFDLYASMQMGGGNAKEKLAEIDKTYTHLLEVDPGFYPAKLAMVELYGFMPAEMGGDTVKAEKYCTELEKTNVVYGAKAREMLMAQNADYVAYWENLIKENPDHPDLLEAQGKVYLLTGDIDNARVNFEKIMELERSRNYLYLDMGRFYMLQAMQGQIPLDSAAPMITNEFEKYLLSDPEPCNPMKAWTKGQLAMVKYRTGNEDLGKELLDEAKTLDSYYSRAFGTPHPILFVPPDSVTMHFAYLSRPF